LHPRPPRARRPPAASPTTASRALLRRRGALPHRLQARQHVAQDIEAALGGVLDRLARLAARAGVALQKRPRDEEHLAGRLDPPADFLQPVLVLPVGFQERVLAVAAGGVD
ncbi:MAG: hypothetical protein ACK56I_16540, partial [bacterium]